MKKANKDGVLAMREKARDDVRKAIKVVLDKYNKDWVNNEREVCGDLMSDDDWMTYAHLCNARDALSHLYSYLVRRD